MASVKMVRSSDRTLPGHLEKPPKVRSTAAPFGDITERKSAEAAVRCVERYFGKQRVAERSRCGGTTSAGIGPIEEALQTQTNILRSILASMGDGVVVADELGKVILYNRRGAVVRTFPNGRMCGCDRLCL